MIRLAVLSVISAVVTGLLLTVPAKGAKVSTPPVYPVTRTVDQVDDYHGVSVKDPYRWLEDANSADTKAWVEAENKVTFGYLEKLPGRDAIKKRLTKLWNYEKFSMPSKQGGRYFWSKNDGLQNQYVLYVAEGLDKEPRVLLDPNKLSKDGTVALSGTSVSEDGKYLAYAISEAGSDWQVWHVRDIDTGKDLPDLIRWCKFTGATWTKDSKGFFYGRYDEPKPGEALQQQNYFKKIYYHKLGDDQSKDTLVYERPDHKDWGFGTSITEDGKYLLVYVSEGTERKNRIFYKDLTNPDATMVEWLDKADASYSVVENEGSVFYVVTDKDAPRKRVVAVDIHKPSEWKEVIPQQEEVLQGINLLGDEFFTTYLKDAKTQVRVYGIDGAFKREIALPGIGSAGGFGGKRDYTETFYSFSSYTVPPTIYRYDVKTGASTVYKQPKVDIHPDDYETKQVFFNSKDGTRVPMFLTYKKGMKLDGNNPTYLYAYGGFNSSLTPGFSVSAMTWMEMGGIYAVANLRGGGEYGQAWHDAGKKLKRQNVFDDFIAAAEYLIQEKYTSSSKLAIAGGSNGGLLVGACMTQRPDLYGAAVPAVGVMDMLRFNKFTIGWAWESDYGSPQNPDEFKALYAYSPYHNLKPGTRYPATLVTTSDHDDRVVPAHSFKFAAALQAAQAQDGPPTLIRIETRAGHGAGKPTAKVIEEVADIYAFVRNALGTPVPKHFDE